MLNNHFAAVDMGTNSFHLIIVKVKEDGSFKMVDREREVIRLGLHEGKNLSVISDDEIVHSIEVLSKFKRLAATYSAPIRAVATSAVRESVNKKEYVEKILKTTGIAIEVINGNEEAVLIFEGIKKAIPLEDKKAFCTDIGGGSTELIYSNSGDINFAESIKIGAVRLSKKFFPDYITYKPMVKACEEYVEARIKANKKIKTDINFDVAIGSSGTVQAAANMIYYLRNGNIKKNLNKFSFNRSELKKITEEVLTAKTPKERLNIKGMETKRADIIPAGLIILNKIFDLFKINQISLSDYALREGIILDTIKHNYFSSMK